MARTAISGFELKDFQSDSPDGFESGSGGTGGTSTTNPRTGNACYALSPASGVSRWLNAPTPTSGFGGSIGTGNFIRFYARFESLPATTARTFCGNHAAGGGLNLTVDPSGKITAYDGVTALSATGLPVITSTTHYYRIEISVVTAASEVRIDGTVILLLLNSSAFSARLGATDTVADTYTIRYDDYCVDNAAYPGDGQSILLLPISDNTNVSWAAGGGGTTNMWQAIDNVPPAGVASGSETNTSNIQSTASTGTAHYTTNLQTYTAAGIGSADTINAVSLVMVEGEDIATGTKTGSWSGTNPTFGSTTFTFGGAGGAHGTTNVSTTLWVPNTLFVAAPTVTLGSSPTVDIVKTDTTTRKACVAFVGAYVEYTPAAGPPPGMRTLPWMDIPNPNVGPAVLRFNFRQPSFQWMGTIPAQQYSSSLSGTIQFVGGMAKQTGKAFGGTTTLNGGIVKFAGKALAGTLVTVGAFAKNTSRAFTGTLSETGFLAKSTSRTVSGTVALGGAVAKIANKALVGTLIAVGVFAKFTLRTFTSIVPGIGSLAKAVSRAITGILTFAGTLTSSKILLRTLTATFSLTGAITGRSINRTLAGILSFVGSIPQRSMTRTLSATLISAGAIARATKRGLAATLSLIGTAAKSTSRSLSANLPLSGVETASKLFVRAFAATLSFVGSIPQRSMTRPFAANLGLVGSTVRALQRGLAATATFVGSSAKSTRRALAAMLSFIGVETASKLFVRTLTATLSFVGSIPQRSVARPVTATLGLIGAATRLNTRGFTATLGLTGATAKQTRRALAATLSLVGVETASKLFVRTLTATLSFVGASQRSIGKVFAANLGLVGAMARATRRILTATTALTGVAFKQVRRALAAAATFSGTLASSHLFFRVMAATLSFVGVRRASTVRGLTAVLATVGRIGPFATQRTFAAVLSTSGAISRATSVLLNAMLSFFPQFFPGSHPVIRVTLAATLGLIGGLSRRIRFVFPLVGTTAYMTFLEGLFVGAPVLAGDTAWTSALEGEVEAAPVLVGVTAYRSALN